MNNFEKIKAMDIDEMAEFIYQIETGQICGCEYCPHYAECNDLMDKGKNYWRLCKDYQKQWLESEVRE